MRAGPVLVGVLAFACINGLRRFFHFQYVPSYFVVFPASLLDPDVARLAGMGPFTPPVEEIEKRKLKRDFLFKTTVASLITFVLIPICLGLGSAFFMTASEVAVCLGVLLVWQGYAGYQSTMDNAIYARKPVASRAVFTSFYTFYLACLGGFMHRGYSFARPFVEKSDLAGLASAAWDIVFLVVISATVFGVLGNLLAYFITERDVL